MLNVVSSLWLEYPLELLTCRFIMADGLADLRVGYEGLCFLDTFDGEFSDDDEVSSTASKIKNILPLHSWRYSKDKPLCDLYFDCFRDFAEHSLSDSDPNVSYSVMGMCRVRIFLTSESVDPGLSDSRNWMSCESEREPTLRTFVYSGSLL